MCRLFPLFLLDCSVINFSLGYAFDDTSALFQNKIMVKLETTTKGARNNKKKLC